VAGGPSAPSSLRNHEMTCCTLISPRRTLNSAGRNHKCGVWRRSGAQRSVASTSTRGTRESNMNSSSWGSVGREMPQPALAEGASVGAMSPRQWGQVECTRGGGQKHSWSAVPRQHRARAMTRLCQQSAGAGGEPLAHLTPTRRWTTNIIPQRCLDDEFRAKM